MARQYCLIRCRHCRIFFLTHRRNHRRLALVSCPFGCRQERERRESIRRSGAYYRNHPDRKRTLNQRRYRLVPRSVPVGCGRAKPREHSPAASAAIPIPKPEPDPGAGTPGERRGPGTPRGDPFSWAPCPPALAEVLPKAQDPEVIGHVRVIVSVLEGRPVSLAEIWETLLKFSRQRTIGQRRPIDYAVAWLNTHPP